MAENKQLTALALLIQARVPAMIVGEPGTGKTKTIAAIVDALNEPLATFIPVVHEPQDIGGYPVPVTDAQGHSKIKLVLVGGWLDKILQEQRGTIFIDEITCAPSMMMAACLRPLDSRMIGEEQLSNDVAIVLACNPPEQAVGGQPIPPPMANRVVWLDWSVDTNAAIEGFLGGWAVPTFPRLPKNWRTQFGGQAALVASFFKRMPHHIQQLPKDEDKRSGPWPSMRSWYSLGVPALAACESVGLGWDMKLLLLAGSVGTGTAQEFITWVKALDLPDPYELLKKPAKFQVYHDRPDKTFAVLNSVVSAATRELTPDMWRAGWEILAIAAKDNATDLAAAAARNLALARGGHNLPLYPELTEPYLPLLEAQRKLRKSMNR
jgi:DNA polymerase III delta prime subunit